MRLVSCAALALLVSPVASQVDRDDFSYPNGAVVPNWTVRNGAWQVQSGRLSATSGAVWAYITKDGISARNSVLDGDFYFVGAGTQFAGLTSRHYGGAGDTNLLMVKIQNNGGVADFDRVFAYERPLALGTFFADIPGGTVAATCRMVTLDGEFWMEVDANQDGIYEQALPRRPITGLLAAGEVGMNGFVTSEMDNFEYFDAVLVPTVGSVPRIGTRYSLDLDTPSPTVPWLGFLALGNAGFPIDVPRRIPLSLDALFTASLGLGIAGVTDGSGKATMTIPLPNNASLVGLDVFAGAVTIDRSRPFAIGHIANESHFEIQP